MTHKMRLNEMPFKMIKSGIKTIELRLYDEKRRSIKAGDLIEFTRSDGGDVLLSEVTALHIFPSFDELYSTLPLLSCGYTDEDIETASPSDMRLYYSKEEEARWGVVGIELRVVEA